MNLIQSCHAFIIVFMGPVIMCNVCLGKVQECEQSFYDSSFLLMKIRSACQFGWFFLSEQVMWTDTWFTYSLITALSTVPSRLLLVRKGMKASESQQCKYHSVPVEISMKKSKSHCRVH